MKISDRLNRLMIDREIQRRFQAEGKEPVGFRGLWMILSGHFRYPTLYNPLGALAGIAFLASTLKPWWYFYVTGGAFWGHNATLVASAFGYKHTVPPEGWRFIIEIPLIVSVILICGMLVYFFIVLYGATMAGKKGKLFVAAGGLLLLIYTAGFFGTVYFGCYRVGGTPLEDFKVVATLPVTVHPQFMPIYYFAIAAAVMCVLFSLTHGWLPIRLHKRKKIE